MIDPNQPLLPGMPADPCLPLDPNRRRAFGSVPGLLKVELGYSEVDVARDNPHLQDDYIVTSLYGRSGRYALDGLALNPQEYGMVPFNVDTFAGRVAAKAVVSHKSSNPVRRGEVEITAPLHALEKKDIQLTKYLDSLAYEKHALYELLRAAHTPEHALMKETELRELATRALTGSFANLLDVVGRQREWNQTEKLGTSQLLNGKLFEGPQTDRIAMWQLMLGRSLQYTSSKHALFTQRSNKVQTGIDGLRLARKRYYEAYGINEL